jgi:hypothetical protein
VHFQDQHLAPFEGKIITTLTTDRNTISRVPHVVVEKLLIAAIEKVLDSKIKVR